MNLSYRPYELTDREDCIRLFRSNIPRYFREHESDDFAAFLDRLEGNFFTVFVDNELVGCGGYHFAPESKSARLCWGIVDKQKHGNRIGEYLLIIRLHEILSTTEATTVSLGTCQLTELFFAKYGFVTNSVRIDGIDQGLDEVEMNLDLSELNRTNIENKWRSIAG